jgi:diguanylate cyclase (GGDEF)-like protein
MDHHGDHRSLQDRSSPGAGQPTVPDDLVTVLELLAQAIVQALGFGVVAVNIARPDGSLKVISVAGHDDARQKLLGAVHSAEKWDKALAASEPWGRLRLADHRDEVAGQGLLSWVPDRVPVWADDAWHPQDAVFAPLIAEDGSRLGVMSVDLPHDGGRPSSATRSALEAFAISAALAIEHASLRARAESSERSLRRLAKHDPLTGAGNRSMLFERLEHAASARPEHRSLMALAFLDLDGFKAINDVRSHEVGDHILQTVAQRIGTVVRPHDTVVRWGGDEFLVLLERLDDVNAALDVVRRILAVIEEPIGFLGQELNVTASLGVAFCRASDRVAADELVRWADSAMHRVKRLGPNSFAVYDAIGDLAL